MRTYFYFILFSLFIFTVSSYAQNNGQEAIIDKKLYHKNIKIYREILKSGPNKDISIKLAEALRMIEKYQEAEIEYEKFIERPGISPIYYKHYSEILCKLGQAEECKRWEVRFKEYEKRADKTSDANIEIDTTGYFLNRAPFNSPETDFGPAYFKNGLLYVSAFSFDSKTTVHEGTGESFYKFYYAEKRKEGGFLPPVQIFKSIDATLYEGPVTLSKDNSTIMLVRNNLNQLKGRDRDKNLILQIVKGKIVNNEIIDIQDFPYNDKIHTLTHPTLSEDGKELFYASNSDSTRGGSDIFLSKLVNGKWTAPENLGDIINTENDEVYPYISPSGKLYFSSTGHNGIGGFDIFVTSRKNGSWTKPVNLASPFNTIFDDFSFIYHAKEGEGFLASNRASSLGSDDIFTFHDVFKNKEEEKFYKPNLVSLVNKDNFVYQKGNKIRGKLKASDPSIFFGKVLQLLDIDKNLVKSCYVTNDGYFSFSNLKPDNYLIVYEKDPVNASVELTMINHKPGYIDKEDLHKFKIGSVLKDSMIVDKNSFVIGKLITTHNKSPNQENVSLIVVDSTGKIIKRIEVGKNNYFIFRNLPADNYFILTEDNNPNYTSHIDYHNADQSKAIMRSNLLEYHYKHLTRDSLRENNIIIHGQVKLDEPGNTTVLLLDQDDNVIGKTVTNSAGYFVFRELDGENMHVMVLNDHPLLTFEHNSVYQKEDSMYHITKNHTLKKLPFDEGTLKNKVIVNGRLKLNEKPLNNRLVMLVDKNNMVVSDAFTNDDGFFAFQHLNPDDYYVVVNEQEPGYHLETQVNLENENMRVKKSAFDGFQYKKGNSDRFISIQGSAFTKSDHKELEDQLILLLNEAGKVVRQTLVGKDGKFIFVNLEPEHYLVLFNHYDPSHMVEMKVVEDLTTKITQTENGKSVTISVPISKEKNKMVIYFDYNSDIIAPQYQKELSQFILEIKSSNPKKLEIMGYSDIVGSDSFNLKLSEKRIRKSKELLLQGLQDDKIIITEKPEGKTHKFLNTYGSYIPALNRRVEFIVKD